MVAVENRQPTREPPMTMPRRPARPAQPRGQQNTRLGHHPGGEADKYYGAEGSRRPPVHQSIPAVDSVLGKVSNKTAETTLDAKTPEPSVSWTPPPKPAVGLGMADESGEFLFPFGGGRVRYGGGKIHYSPVHPTVTADDDSITAIEVSEDGNNPALSPRLDLESDSDEDRDIPVALPADHRSPLSDGSSDDRSTVDDDTNSFEMDRPVINWSPLLGHDFGDMVEDGIDLVGIVMARPASQRQPPLSVSSSGNSRDSDEANPIQMARPAARRMVLSVCSSPEDPIATNSGSGEVPMARPVSRR
jgi:hypothetical protein